MTKTGRSRIYIKGWSYPRIIPLHIGQIKQGMESSVWETIHRNYMCAYFAKIAFNKSPTCVLFKNEQRWRTHIFLNCEVILECYRKFQKVTGRIFNLGTIDMVERAFGLRLEGEDEKNGTI